MKNIRLAFSGSGFKFPAHVGAFNAIVELGYTPIEVAGTSGGSIISALIASGMSAEEMKELSMTYDWSPMLSFSPLSMITGKGYCNGKNLLNFLLEKTKGLKFSDLPIDLTIMSSDITNLRPFKWSKETTPYAQIALASRASASIPIVYNPVVYNGTIHMDGGMANNIPVMKLKQDDVLRVGIELVSTGTPLSPGPHNTPSLSPRTIELMLSSNESTQVMFGQYSGAKIVDVETGFCSGLDRNMTTETRQKLYDNGYNSVMSSLKK